MEQTLSHLDFPRTAEEAVRALCYPGLRYRNEYYFNSLPVYQRLVNVAFHHGCRKVLELGAGLSTALWARYAMRTGARVTTIDADFEPMRSYVQSPQLMTLIEEYVEQRVGVTISPQELSEFYSSAHEVFGNVAAADIAETIERFSQDAPETRMNQVRDSVGSANWSTRDIFIADGTIQYPPKLLDALSPSGRFAKDIAFLEHNPVVPFDPQETFDLIFFDSGEYSSAIEWLTLKDRINVGGLAAFHDIFFPKSMKNFLVCASICADPDWRVVLLDDSTIQGLLIAQRL